MVKELRQFWDSLPHKLAVVVLLGAWVALFEYFGMAQLYWLPTPSLFKFVYHVLLEAARTDMDDQLGLWMPWLFLFFIVYRRQELTLRGPVQPSWVAVGLVLCALALHYVAYLVQQHGISSIAFLVGVYGLTGVIWGREWLHRSFFPFIILAFMVPTDQYLEMPTFRLRHYSATAATWIGQTVFNLPLLRQGTMVSATNAKGTPLFQFDVVAACSGIRSLKVILLLTVIYGFLQFKSAWRRWVILAFAPVLALSGNICRLVGTFVVGEAWGQRVASALESKLGFITFGVALGGVVLVARWLREPVAPQKPEGAPPTSLPVSHPIS